MFPAAACRFAAFFCLCNFFIIIVRRNSEASYKENTYSCIRGLIKHTHLKYCKGIQAGLLLDPEWGEDTQKPFHFFSKNETFFLAQTLQASLGFGYKKNLPAKLKGCWSESVPTFLIVSLCETFSNAVDRCETVFYTFFYMV